MKRLSTSVLVLALLASTGVAAAQEGGYRPEARRSWKNNPDQPRPAPEARAPREAPAARTPEAAAEAPRVRDDGERRGGERRDGNRGDRGGQQVQQPGAEQRGDWNRGDRGDRTRQPSPDQRRDGVRDDRRPDGDRGDRQRDRDWNNDRRDGDRNGRDWNNDRRDGRGLDGRNGRGWDDARRHQPRPRYDRRRYEPNWRSQQRYRGWEYRRPSGFYVRSWVFGDMLPRNWWEPQYRLDDWWSYGLPIPPIGYEWVRVGDDALLVDMFSGRVVQVARNLFW
ncbi:RcnB family protein [Phenylobacterium sp.]|uniref:RcnB family protein n=1 Tax=Phenylobacterium sp. TaxID=1871053 RepID=UPI00286CBE0A|nr:RcnB family protein [Phenylobacterium sp.]